MARFEAESFLRDVLGAKNIHVQGDEIQHNCLIMNHENDYKNPGASLNADKLLYNCWKCGSGGTLLWLTAEVLQINSSKARKVIQGSFDALDQAPEQSMMEAETIWAESPSTEMPRYSLRMLSGWICQTKYLDTRGVSREVQREMQTGLYKDNMDEVGGIKIKQPRIVIPHIFEGILRGWTMRLIDKRQVGTKYKHTSQFPKQNTLYNYDDAKQYDSVIVVESPLSVLKLKSEGFHNVVATFGAQVNPRQVELIAHWAKVILFPDGDQSGYRALVERKRDDTVVGLIHELAEDANVWVVDHGRTGELDESGFNNLDPANYTATQLQNLFEQMLTDTEFNYEWSNDAHQKVRRPTEDRVDYVSFGDLGAREAGEWDR